MSLRTDPSRILPRAARSPSTQRLLKLLELLKLLKLLNYHYTIIKTRAPRGNAADVAAEMRPAASSISVIGRSKQGARPELTHEREQTRAALLKIDFSWI